MNGEIKKQVLVLNKTYFFAEAQKPAGRRVVRGRLGCGFRARFCERGEGLGKIKCPDSRVDYLAPDIEQ